MITGRVVGVEAVISRLRREPGRLYLLTKEEVSRLTFKLQRKVKAEKLSGQVLNVKSGRGRRSISAKVDARPQEIIGSVGTNVNYMGGWERGFTKAAIDIFPTKKRALYWPGADHPVRHVHQPARAVKARPFLRPALEEMRAEITTRLKAVATGRA